MVDFFLKLDGIEGESEDSKHKSEIQLHSFSWGGHQVTSVAGTGGSGAGKVSLSEFSIMKSYDKASPKLFQAMLKGTHIATGVMTAVKAGGDGKPYLTVSFGELFVTNIQVSASSEIPTESISFSYNTVKVDYSVQNAQGNLASTGAISYNLKTNVVS